MKARMALLVSNKDFPTKTRPEVEGHFVSSRLVPKENVQFYRSAHRTTELRTHARSRQSAKRQATLTCPQRTRPLQGRGAHSPDQVLGRWTCQT